MSTMHYEVEIAYRREQLLQTRQDVGLSRRERRRRARLADGASSPGPAGRILRPVPTPRLG